MSNFMSKRGSDEKIGSGWCPKLVSKATEIKKKGDRMILLNHRICFSSSKILGVRGYPKVD